MLKNRVAPLSLCQKRSPNHHKSNHPRDKSSSCRRTVTLTISLQDVPSVKSMMLYNFIYDSAYVEIVEAKWLVDGIIAT